MERKRGSSRMREQGFKVVTLWLTEVEYEVLARMANFKCTTRAKFLRQALMDSFATEDEHRRNRNYR
jgi:hypothetical protein